MHYWYFSDLCIYVESRKMVQMNLFPRQEQKQTRGRSGGRAGWDGLGEYHWYIHTATCGSWWEGETEERLGCPGLRRMSRGWGSRGKRVFKGRVLLHEAGAEGLTGLLGSSCSPRSPSCPQGGHTASSLCLKLSPSSFLKTEVLWMVTWLIYALKLIKVDTLEVS